MKLFGINFPSRKELEEETRRLQEDHEKYMTYFRELVRRAIEDIRADRILEAKARQDQLTNPWYRRLEKTLKQH